MITRQAILDNIIKGIRLLLGQDINRKGSILSIRRCILKREIQLKKVNIGISIYKEGKSVGSQEGWGNLIICKSLKNILIWKKILMIKKRATMKFRLNLQFKKFSNKLPLKLPTNLKMILQFRKLTCFK